MHAGEEKLQRGSLQTTPKTACEILSGMLRGGIAIRGPFAEDDKRHRHFQTLVHFNGSLCLSLHRSAFESKEFSADLRKHIDHVNAQLSSLRKGGHAITGISRAIASLPFLAAVVYQLLGDTPLGGPQANPLFNPTLGSASFLSLILFLCSRAIRKLLLRMVLKYAINRSPLFRAGVSISSRG